MPLKSWLSFALGLLLIVGLFFVIGRLSSSAKVTPADAIGLWQGSAQTEDRTIPFSLEIKSDGAALSGTVTAPQVGSFPCDQLEVDPEGDVSFSVHVDGRKATVTGKLDPAAHTMTGSATSDASDGKWSLAKKQP